MERKKVFKRRSRANPGTSLGSIPGPGTLRGPFPTCCPSAFPCKAARGCTEGDLHPGLQDLLKKQFLTSWLPRTQERAAAAQAAASATLSEACLGLLSCQRKLRKKSNAWREQAK